MFIYKILITSVVFVLCVLLVRMGCKALSESAFDKKTILTTLLLVLFLTVNRGIALYEDIKVVKYGIVETGEVSSGYKRYKKVFFKDEGYSLEGDFPWNYESGDLVKCYYRSDCGTAVDCRHVTAPIVKNILWIVIFNIVAFVEFKR